jgi:hypothetical protein
MNAHTMATLRQRMNFIGDWVRLLFKNLECLLELFNVMKNTEELNEAICNSIN